jgi:hypothetical protein
MSETTIETVVRLKRDGITLGEYIVRGEQVDVVIFDRSGARHPVSEMSLAQFLDMLAGVRDNLARQQLPDFRA